MFFIESQPDSPILIRDLSAVIVPPNTYSPQPKIEVMLYFESRSKKAIKGYSYDMPKETEVKDAGGSGGFSNLTLMPGESRRGKLTFALNGESVVFRVANVEFEDGIEWTAARYNGVKAKRSAGIVPKSKEAYSAAETSAVKRTLARGGWAEPVFTDNVTKVISGKPRTIDGVEVQTRVHELKPERLGFVESCDIEKDQLAEAAEDLDFEVERFISYEFKGKIFAYEVAYDFFQEDGYEIGAGSSSFYVDETGTGTFQVICENRDLVSLPAWIKNLAAK